MTPRVAVLVRLIDLIFQIAAWWYSRRANEHEEVANQHQREAQRIRDTIELAAQRKSDLLALLLDLQREPTSEASPTPPPAPPDKPED